MTSSPPDAESGRSPIAGAASVAFAGSARKVSTGPRRWLVPAVVAVLTLQLGLPLMLLAKKNRILFLPEPLPTPASVAHREGEEGLAPRLVLLQDGVGSPLPALDFRPPSARPDGPVIVFLHGNAANLALRVYSMERLASQLGMRILAPEYPGYGGAPGSPDESSVTAAAIATVDHLVAEGVPPSKIVLYGESLGGAVVLATAARRPVGGIIVEATFSSLSSMAKRVHPWLPVLPWMLKDDFPSERHATRLTVPLLALHGGRDTIVPPEEGRALAAAAPNGRFRLVPDAGHGDVLDTGGAPLLDEVREAILLWTR